MIQNHHWREAARATMRQAAADQDRTVSAIMRLAGVDRGALEPRHDDKSMSFATLAKLDGAGVSWKTIATEAARLAGFNHAPRESEAATDTRPRRT